MAIGHINLVDLLESSEKSGHVTAPSIRDCEYNGFGHITTSNKEMMSSLNSCGPREQSSVACQSSLIEHVSRCGTTGTITHTFETR